jgi:very-short-patch-repair endonuclease/prophage antirepressor-like protein
MISPIKMTSLTTYTHDDIEYFIATEIATIFGYKSTQAIIKKAVSECNKLLFHNYQGDKVPEQDPRTILITRTGIDEMIRKTRKQIDMTMFEKLLPAVTDKDKEEHIQSEDELLTYSYISNGLCFEYFVGYEITTLLGYKNPEATIRNSVSKCNQLLFHDFPGVKYPMQDPRTILITNDGAREILTKTRKTIDSTVQYILDKFHIDVTNAKTLSDEQKNLSFITYAFKIEEMIPQYPVGPYRLDLYFPKYKLINECDEFGHNNRNPALERERMDFINKELGITDANWIRFNPNAKYFDVAKVIGQIYLHINNMKIIEAVPEIKYVAATPVRMTEEERQLKLESKHLSRAQKNIELLPEKSCTYCNVIKPLEEFNYAREHRDGRENICRICKKEKARLRAEKFKEEHGELTEKVCSSCGDLKDICHFYKDKNRTDGYYHYCKVCHKERTAVPKHKVILSEKQCTKCQIVKPIDNFHKASNSTNGHSIYCKECSKQINMESRTKQRVENSTT